MKRILTILLSLLLCSVTVSAQGNAPLPILETIPDTQGFGVGAEAAIVMEMVTGRVMFSQNANKELPIASTTKIMTALLTLEQPNLDTVFPVDNDAIMVEGSSMGLRKGDLVSLRALATGMLLSSGNDAANAASVRIAGSIPAFTDLMNQRVQQLGLRHTSFETPSGLDGEFHYSSAYDMAIITRAALSNPDFAEICSQYKMRATFGNPPYDRWLTNHNKLLNYYEGTIGVKTGFTKKAGRCLVSAVHRDGITLLCVTLDCPDDWNVHQRLYDRYFADLEVQDLSADLPPLTVPVAGGTVGEVAAVKYDMAQIAVPLSGSKVTYQITLPPFVYAPVLSGQYLGQVEIFLDKKPVYTLSLIARQDVPQLHPYKEKISLIDRFKKLFDR